MSDSCNTVDCSLPASSVHGDSLGKNTGVSCQCLRQGLPNPGIEPRSPVLQADSLPTEVETPILWPPDVKNWLFGKDSGTGKDWRQEEQGTTEDEVVGWHHQLDGHEFECFGSWWQTGKPGMLQSMGSQRVGHNRVTELNWTESAMWSWVLIFLLLRKTNGNEDMHINNNKTSNCI